MKILLVEDTYDQESAIREAILNEFPEMEIEVIRTELDFRKRLESIVQNRPNLIIMDGMIRWTDPSEEMESPPLEVREGGPFQAGRRCQRLVTSKAPNIPLFFHTILDREDLDEERLPKDICYLAKRDDPKELIEKIRRLLQKPRN